MLVEKFIKKLVPKNDNFFLLFEEDVQNLITASETLNTAFLFPLSEENKKKLREIEDLEHKGDTITHKLFRELSASFVTPFDREDIHTLAAALDDVLDLIKGTSQRVILYEVNNFPPDGKKIIETLLQSVHELGKIIPLLRDMDNKSQILTGCVNINSCENKADDLFEHAVADLFKVCRDPIELIKIKEILMGLESATDKCEDAANAIESIIIKNT